MKSTFLFLASILVFTFFACKRNSNAPIDNLYRFNGEMTIDGLKRTYLLNLPPRYYDSSGFSLIIAMHGGGGSASQFESTSRITDKANASNFIVVYPEGVESNGLLKARTWNAGSCCDYAVEKNIGDVKFLNALIDNLTATYKINPKKIYATGHSNGGMMAYRLACELSNKIAAIAPNSCTMVVSSCNPLRPVPVLHMHSVLDTNVPYLGGAGSGVGTVGLKFPSVDSVLNAWSVKNTCRNPSQVITNDNSFKLTKWTNCNGQSNIEYYLTKDGGHGWPGGLPGSAMGDTPSKVITANNLIWDFFQQYQLP